MTFNGTSGRESPARTTRTLVLNGGDGTLGSPINSSGGSEGSRGERNLSLGSSEVGLVTEIHFREFFVGQVSKLGDTVASSVVLVEHFDSS